MVTRQYKKYTNIRKTQKTHRNMMWTTATYLQHNKQHITRSPGPKQACAGHNRLAFWVVVVVATMVVVVVVVVVV